MVQQRALQEAAPRNLEEQPPPAVSDDLCLATAAPLLDEIMDVIQRMLGLNPELASLVGGSCSPPPTPSCPRLIPPVFRSTRRDPIVRMTRSSTPP
jgi:hypothetical protein